jgi:hypothetical protein
MSEIISGLAPYVVSGLCAVVIIYAIYRFIGSFNFPNPFDIVGGLFGSTTGLAGGLVGGAGGIASGLTGGAGGIASGAIGGIGSGLPGGIPGGNFFTPLSTKQQQEQQSQKQEKGMLIY